MQPVPASGKPARPSEEIAVPRSVIVAAGALMLFTIAVAGTARLTGHNHVTMPPTEAVASRDLTFTDRPDGGVSIADAATGQAVSVVEPTTGGFMRGIMRGLVREHRLDELAPGTAFRLTRWADGRLSISDPGNGTSIELSAFGPTNEATFVRLLDGVPVKAAGAAPAAPAEDRGATR